MASIASELVKPYLERFNNAILEQSHYICCFTCITEDFEKERKNLIAKKETLEENVRVANRRGYNIQRVVTLWQEQAIDLIKEDTKTKVTCFFGWLPNCKWQYSRGKELEGKIKDIKRLMDQHFENVGITRDVPGIEYYSSQNYVSFESRKLKFEELFNALKDDNNYMIGLHGMGGIGKTTLARETGKELQKLNFFYQVIDTTLSNTPDIKKIQDDIAGPLGLPLKDFTESERPKKLRERLINGDKILVILDDVWEDISFEEIGIPFKDSRHGCRILVTTREMRTCNKMGCEKIIQLGTLLKEEGWILFKKLAGLSDSSSKSFLHKGRKISKECKGLPIAIAVIASSLKGQRCPEEWDAALISLQKSMLVGDNDENWSKVYTCLKYSYDNMKNERAKKLFLLCSMFQEDEEISQELLVKLSIGAGLNEKIDDDYNYDACRNEVIVAKNKLIDSCLLLNCESGRVKMHDLVREVALSIANKEIITVNTYNKNEMKMVEKGKNIKYLLCEGESSTLFSSKFDGSKLDILIVYLDDDGDVEVPNSFFENIAGLRVLYLSNRYDKLAISLPQSIQSLTNIRYLYLKGFIISDFSILGILKDLQTLELVSCSMDELPREIVQLVKLKLLKLNDIDFKRNNSFEVIESCTSLEELNFTGGEEVSKMHHNVKLHNYKRFCISDSFISKKWLERNTLDICMADEVFSEETFKNLVQKAEFLRLRRLGGVWKNLIPEIFSNISLCNLKYLTIEGCPMLTSLFELSTTQSLLLLEKLVIKNCEQLKSIVRDENERKDSREEIVDGQNDNNTIISMFPNLKSLQVSKCPQLHFILPVAAARNVSNIEDNEEEDLQDVIFTNPKELILEDLPNFVDIFPKCDESMSSSLKKSFSINESKAQIESKPVKNKISHWIHKYRNKRRTIKISLDSKDQLQDPSLSMVNDSNANDVMGKEMKVVLRNIALNDTPQTLVGSKIFVTLQNVTELVIQNCQKTEVIFCASMLECLPYLHTLGILRCNELKQIIGEDTKNQRKPFFPRLKALVITKCSKLKCVFPISTSKMLPKLEVLVIIRACMLEKVFDGDSDQRAEIPNLKAAVFFELPSLCQEIEFLTLKDCLVKNCPKLQLSSSSSFQSLQNIHNSIEGSFPGYVSRDLYRDSCHHHFEAEEISNQNPTIENSTTEESAFGTEFETTSFKGSELTSSQKNDEDNQQKKEDVVKQSKETVEEEQEIVEKAPGFGIPSIPILLTTLHKRHSLEDEEGEMVIPSTNLNLNLNIEPMQEDEEGEMVIPSTTLNLNIEPTQEDEEGEMVIPSTNLNLNIEPATTKDVYDGDFRGIANSVVIHSQNTNDTVSELTNQHIKNEFEEMLDDVDEESKDREVSNQNEMAKAQVASGTELALSQEIKKTYEEGTTSAYAKTIALSTDSESEHGEGQIYVPLSIVNIELETTNDVGVGDIQEPSKSTIAHFETKNSPEKLSQITQDSSFACTATRELELLVSNKHLALENLTLLTNFLVKHPRAHLADNAKSDIYKGFAYTCLAHLLKFLQSHSVFDVLGSSQSELIELLQALRDFGFNRDWLDDFQRLKVL